MTHTRNALVILLAMASITTPAFALPNNGAFDRSAEAFKLKMQQVCNDVRQTADSIQDKNKDSPLPPPRVDDADNRSEAQSLREKGRAAGCKGM